MYRGGSRATLNEIRLRLIYVFRSPLISDSQSSAAGKLTSHRLALLSPGGGPSTQFGDAAEFPYIQTSVTLGQFLHFKTTSGFPPLLPVRDPTLQMKRTTPPACLPAACCSRARVQ